MPDEAERLPHAPQQHHDVVARDVAGALGVEPLPRSLNEALDVMEESKLARETLGEHVFEWFLRNKRAEWAEFQSKVTPFELERYLGNW